jgi:hypothetical protein
MSDQHKHTHLVKEHSRHIPAKCAFKWFIWRSLVEF